MAGAARRDDVVIGAAVDRVLAVAGDDVIRAVIALNVVIAVADGDDVVVGAAGDVVVAVARIDGVVARTAGNRIVSRAAMQLVGVDKAKRGSVGRHDGVVAVAAPDDVVAEPRIDGIVACAAVDEIVAARKSAGIADQRVAVCSACEAVVERGAGE